jgi:hypothetical protein
VTARARRFLALVLFAELAFVGATILFDKSGGGHSANRGRGRRSRRRAKHDGGAPAGERPATDDEVAP